MYQTDSSKNIPYINYTDSSNLSGFIETSLKSDSLINIMQQPVFINFMPTYLISCEHKYRHIYKDQLTSRSSGQP